MGQLVIWLVALAVFVGGPVWYALRRRGGGSGTAEAPGDAADQSEMASWRFQGSGGSR